MLDADRTMQRDYPSETGAFNWVIGFQDNRAALVTDLAWIDPDGTNPDERITKVTV
jgi:hypothetical protein